MTDIFSKIPSMRVDELRGLQRNAQSMLDKASSDSNEFRRATAVMKAVEDEISRRHLPGAIDRFKQDFPKSFDDERFWHEERTYKREAAAFCKTHLSSERLLAALASGHFDEALNNVKRMVQMTNFLHPTFEKSKLLQKINEPDMVRPFLTALNDVMWGAELPEIRLERFCEFLEEWGIRKWTFATYFLFFAHPEDCMFVKPESMSKALDASPYPLSYDSKPSAKLYRGILDFSVWLKNRLALEGLEAVDMIDVQSFIYYMAPTGKWKDGYVVSDEAG